MSGKERRPEVTKDQGDLKVMIGDPEEMVMEDIIEEAFDKVGPVCSAYSLLQCVELTPLMLYHKLLSFLQYGETPCPYATMDTWLPPTASA